MPSAKLSALHLRRLKPGKVYLDGAGLRLRVKANGTAFWIFRYRRDGRDRDLGLGPFRDVSAAKARELAKEAREILRAGGDPKAERAKARARNVPTFREAAEAMIEAKRHEWRSEKHAAQWTNTLRDYAYRKLGDLAVSDIETEHVLKVLEPLWTTKTETAQRLRGRIAAVLDWAATRRYRTGANPAAWKGHLETILAQPRKVRRVRHHPALPYSEIPAFLPALAKQEGIASRALAFAILTAARTNETLGARWSEIEGDVWTLPPQRMKALRLHRVPLSRQALDLLEALPRFASSTLLFPGQSARKPLSNGSLLAVLKRMGRGDLTVHGFRSTFRDWAAEQTNFPRELAETALAHVAGDKTEAAYLRSDVLERRRALLQLWADYCLPPAEAGVLPLRRKQAN